MKSLSSLIVFLLCLTLYKAKLYIEMVSIISGERLSFVIVKDEDYHFELETKIDVPIQQNNFILTFRFCWESQSAKMWQFYLLLASAIGGGMYVAWVCERYAIVINYGTTCHLELDPLIKEQTEIEESIRRSEIEGFYEEQIAEERKRRKENAGRRA